MMRAALLLASLTKAQSRTLSVETEKSEEQAKSFSLETNLQVLMQQQQLNKEATEVSGSSPSARSSADPLGAPLPVVKKKDRRLGARRGCGFWARRKKTAN